MDREKVSKAIEGIFRVKYGHLFLDEEDLGRIIDYILANFVEKNCLDDILTVQVKEAEAEKKRGDGNYMRGLANGLICAKAIMTGEEAEYTKKQEGTLTDHREKACYHDPKHPFYYMREGLADRLICKYCHEGHIGNRKDCFCSDLCREQWVSTWHKPEGGNPLDVIEPKRGKIKKLEELEPSKLRGVIGFNCEQNRDKINEITTALNELIERLG